MMDTSTKYLQDVFVSRRCVVRGGWTNNIHVRRRSLVTLNRRVKSCVRAVVHVRTLFRSTNDGSC